MSLVPFFVIFFFIEKETSNAAKYFLPYAALQNSLLLKPPPKFPITKKC